MMHIEDVTISDHEELIGVWESSGRATHHFLRESYIIDLRYLILSTYFDAVKLKCIKSSSGKIIGFLGTSKDEIEMLFVHSDFIAKGIGKTFINYAVNILELKKVAVNEQNTNALEFYKKMGFKVVSRDDLDPLGKPYPVLHMTL